MTSSADPPMNGFVTSLTRVCVCAVTFLVGRLAVGVWQWAQEEGSGGAGCWYIGTTEYACHHCLHDSWEARSASNILLTVPVLDGFIVFGGSLLLGGSWVVDDSLVLDARLKALPPLLGEMVPRVVWRWFCSPSSSYTTRCLCKEQYRCIFHFQLYIQDYSFVHVLLLSFLDGFVLFQNISYLQFTNISVYMSVFTVALMEPMEPVSEPALAQPYRRMVRQDLSLVFWDVFVLPWAREFSYVCGRLYILTFEPMAID